MLSLFSQFCIDIEIIEKGDNIYVNFLFLYEYLSDFRKFK